MAITWNILMVKHSVHRCVDSCKTTVGYSTFDNGVVLTLMEMGGQTLQQIGCSPGGTGDAWPLDPTQWANLMAMDAGDNPQGTTADVCPDSAGTSVGPAEVEIVGDVIPMVMVGQTWNSLFTSQRSGVIPTVMVLVTLPMVIGRCMSEVRGTSLMDRLGCRDTDGDGWSDNRNLEGTHWISRLLTMKHYNGEILMVTVMVTSL